MNFSYINATFTEMKNKLEQDELLIILDYLDQNRSNELSSLLTNACESLEKTNHYLQIKSGFIKAPHQRWIFATLDPKKSNNSLERRWVFNALINYVKSCKVPQKISFFIEGDYLEEKSILVEDFVAHLMDARYTRFNCNRINVYTSDIKKLNQVDPYRSIRFQHGIEFRKWVNENPDELTSIEIGHRLHRFAEETGCQYQVFTEKELAAENMNLLLAVGQASTRSPSRLHIVDYNPKKNNEAPLLLIGKGVTFDTGGINLKPHESFVNCMKNDMGGAGLVSMLFKSLVLSQFPHRVVVAVPCCENLIAERSMKPGSIIKSRAGKNVIIEHTDAEGRLILADAIDYCQEKFNPKKTIVAATLTTAALRQFTNFYTPVHFADQFFQEKLTSESEKWGELFTYWQKFLPFLDGNMHTSADLTNMGRMPADATGCGGSSVAAHFLNEFARSPLIHIDIFASTWNWSKSYPGAHYGATGAPFNSLFMMLRQFGAQWLS